MKKEFSVGQVAFYLPDMGGGTSPMVVLKHEGYSLVAYCPSQGMSHIFAAADIGTIEEARDQAIAYLDRVITMPDLLPLAKGHLAALAEAIVLGNQVPGILKAYGIAQDTNSGHIEHHVKGNTVSDPTVEFPRFDTQILWLEAQKMVIEETHRLLDVIHKLKAENRDLLTALERIVEVPGKFWDEANMVRSMHKIARDAITKTKGDARE